MVLVSIVQVSTCSLWC